MGGLPALIASAVLVLSVSACERKDKKDAPLAPKARSQAVAGNPAEATAAPSASPTQPVAEAPKQPRKLCDGQMKAGKPMPTSEVATAAAPGAPEPAARIPVGGGKWTWVNFWAAWCVPCKEEMPRLSRWEKQLAADGKRFRLVYVSLDDDPRQLQQFLSSQPATGVRSTYWLREGKQREEWLEAVDVDTDPELPAHVLFDPSGKARCVVQGAVEDSDYARVAALVSG